jgi:MFS transporter, DHA2 family, multidrug resistance protein
VVGRLMNHLPARDLVMAGFLALGASMLLTSRINPQVNFGWLVTLRAFQTVGIALLFAPIAVVTTSTLRPDQNNHGAALFAMARNVGGSVGISIATALVTERTQTHMAYLVDHLAPFDQRFNDLVSQRTASLLALGRSSIQASSDANGSIFKTLIAQSSVMGYLDVFIYFGFGALAVVPLCFLIGRSVGKAPAGAH